MQNALSRSLAQPEQFRHDGYVAEETDDGRNRQDQHGLDRIDLEVLNGGSRENREVTVTLAVCVCRKMVSFGRPRSIISYVVCG